LFVCLFIETGSCYKAQTSLEFAQGFQFFHMLANTYFMLYVGWGERYWGLNSGPAPWASPPALFLWIFFQDFWW
jgi:hypothetical protein